MFYVFDSHSRIMLNYKGIKPRDIFKCLKLYLRVTLNCMGVKHQKRGLSFKPFFVLLNYCKSGIRQASVNLL